ncbi:hypothetical protein GCM10007989_26180 [Devosia pacifica]|uniref:Prohead serine protease domain-containing protein n=1 Tax=Devosia pacifica TaxID=1335967 RepID=A0A918S904_9HYPH|nr:HK97 family phage prohead protease [Devosia pacifica]GHA29366.1 hypothetical protein GCM10007989_26180 [Devosia pacifica]
MTVAVDAAGRFAGYASLFNVRDASGDEVLPGAFARSLARRGPAEIRMLFQHDPKEPVGTWHAVREDARGLWVEGRLINAVPRAEALRALIAGRALDGLSIGFRTVAAQRGRGRRRLVEIDLWEISIVTFPMLAGARIASGKSSQAAKAIAAAISVLKEQ